MFEWHKRFYHENKPIFILLFISLVFYLSVCLYAHKFI